MLLGGCSVADAPPPGSTVPLARLRGAAPERWEAGGRCRCGRRPRLGAGEPRQGDAPGHRGTGPTRRGPRLADVRRRMAGRGARVSRWSAGRRGRGGRRTAPTLGPALAAGEGGETEGEGEREGFRNQKLGIYLGAE